MNNNTEPKKELPKNYSRTALDNWHAKAKELGLRPSTIYKMAFLDFCNESTFTRLWNNTQAEPRIELEVAIRLCRALGMTLSEALGIEVAVSQDLKQKVDEEVARNTSEVLAQRREKIEVLESANSALKDELRIKNETLQTIHTDYNRRLDALYAELKSCREKLDAVNQRLIDKTIERSDKILELLESFVIRGE